MDIRQDDARASGPQGYFPSLTAIDWIWLKILLWAKHSRWTLNIAQRQGAAMLPAIILMGSAATAAAPISIVNQAEFDAITRFQTRLNSADSASEVLRQWCSDHGLAKPPIIRAVRLDDAEKPASTVIRRRLGAGRGELLRYRHVQLVCGARVLSEADNWYRPSLLTADMNKRLDQTDTPFGLVVAALEFRRAAIAVDWLVKPITRTDQGGARRLPRYILRNTAILRTGKGSPFSLVVETYTSEILADESSIAAPLSP